MREDWSAASNPPGRPVTPSPAPSVELEREPGAPGINLYAHTHCPGCGGIIHLEDGCPYCLTGIYSTGGNQ